MNATHVEVDPSLADGTTFRVKASNAGGAFGNLRLKFVFSCLNTRITPLDQVDHILTNTTRGLQIIQYDFTTFFQSVDKIRCPITTYSLVKYLEDAPLEAAT